MPRWNDFKRRSGSAVLRFLVYVWVFPASVIGLAFLPLAWLSGGGFRLVNGVMEIHGGLIERLLARGFGLGRGCTAMTLGHVVLGRNLHCLDTARAHERIHVQQYERWGILFIPAYLLSSVMAHLRGQDAYFDNAFEREAYGNAPRPLKNSAEGYE